MDGGAALDREPSRNPANAIVLDLMMSGEDGPTSGRLCEVAPEDDDQGQLRQDGSVAPSGRSPLPFVILGLVPEDLRRCISPIATLPVRRPLCGPVKPSKQILGTSPRMTPQPFATALPCPQPGKSSPISR